MLLLVFGASTASIFAMQIFAQESVITEQMLTAVEDFLMGLPTIFYDNNIPRKVEGEFAEWAAHSGMEEGQFFFGWDEETRQPFVTSEIPPIYFIRKDWSNSEFYDRYGNRFSDVPWIMWNHLYATDFLLFDFDQNGIPYIMVLYWGNYEGSGDGGAPASLFRFVDGEYRRIVSVNWWNGELDYQWFGTGVYFLDENGSLVLNRPPFVDLSSEYYFVNFDRSFAEVDNIASLWHSWDGEENHVSWINHITGIDGISTDDFPVFMRCFEGEAWHICHDGCWAEGRDIVRFIPGTTNRLIHIPPMYQMQESIYMSVKQRLLAEGMLLGELVLTTVNLSDINISADNEIAVEEEISVESNDTVATDNTAPLGAESSNLSNLFFVIIGFIALSILVTMIIVANKKRQK